MSHLFSGFGFPVAGIISMWHVNIEVANWFFSLCQVFDMLSALSLMSGCVYIRSAWFVITTRISIPASALPNVILGLNSTVIDIYY